MYEVIGAVHPVLDLVAARLQPHFADRSLDPELDIVLLTDLERLLALGGGGGVGRHVGRLRMPVLRHRGTGEPQQSGQRGGHELDVTTLPLHLSSPLLK